VSALEIEMLSALAAALPRFNTPWLGASNEEEWASGCDDGVAGAGFATPCFLTFHFFSW